MNNTQRSRDYFPQITALLKDPATRTTAFQVVSRESGIEENTLRVSYFREFGAQNGHKALTEDEELTIVCVIETLTQHKDPPSRERICAIAKDLYHRDFSMKWCCNFLKRHSKMLSTLRPKVLSPIRARDDLVERTRSFITQWSILIEKKVLREDNLFVFDETRVGRPEGGKKLVHGLLSSSPHKETTRGEVFATYIPFSRPTGETPFRVYIFKNGGNESGPVSKVALGRKESLRDMTCTKRVYLSTDTGYLTKEAFQYVMEEFERWWVSISGGKDCYLLSDNLGAHQNSEVVQSMTRRRIFLWNIMPGTSYWFQVHDNTPFGSLKKGLQNQIDSIAIRGSDSPHIRRQLVAGCFYKAEESAFTRQNIIHAFRDVGLWPFNPEKILSRAIEEEHHNQQTEDARIARIVRGVIEGDAKREEEKRQVILDMVDEVSVTKILPFDHSPLRKIPRKEDRRGLPAVTSLFNSPTDDDRENSIPPSTPCSTEGCKSKFRSSKKWRYCTICSKAFCPRHHSEWNKHLSNHSRFEI